MDDGEPTIIFGQEEGFTAHSLSLEQTVEHEMKVNCLIAIASLSLTARAGFDLGFHDDTDLTRFVTRPEIRVPRLNVTHRSEGEVTPGLWFMAPYAKLNEDFPPEDYYQACSAGPVIYDNDGELIWSGACLMQNQNAYDFRVFTDEQGDDQLSMIIAGYDRAIGRKGIVLNSAYDLASARNTTAPPVEPDGINMHEYRIIDQGRSALLNTWRARYIDTSDLNVTDVRAGWVSDVGLREVDVATGRVNFEWWALDKDHISPTESTVDVDVNALSGPWPRCWNWFHPNSVDKSSEGDYMISGRFVDAIYKISGIDGKILWRLGGKRSDFELVNFTFSKQHDARFLGSDLDTGEELISLFDNAKAIQAGGIDTVPTAEASSGLVVALDARTGKARVRRRIVRPDGGLTAMRGNFQLLSNGYAVGGWSENGYVSEHAPDGRMVFEARYASKRFVTYRAYKQNFTGHPGETPVLRVSAFGETRETSTTVWYVSWNGATEVNEWRFCRAAEDTCSEVVGQVKKTGFETMFQSDGTEEMVLVEAIARNASVIGKSIVQQIEMPSEWSIANSTKIDPEPKSTEQSLSWRMKAKTEL